MVRTYFEAARGSAGFRSIAALVSVLAMGPWSGLAVDNQRPVDSEATPPGPSAQLREFATLDAPAGRGEPAASVTPLFAPLPPATSPGLSNRLTHLLPGSPPLFTTLSGKDSATTVSTAGELKSGKRPLFLPLTNSMSPLPPGHVPGKNRRSTNLVSSLPGFTNISAVARLEPELLRPPSEPFTLGPGDHLEIQLIGDPTTSTSTVVGPDGKIYFNLLPGLDVWGLTPAETKALLEQEFLKFMREKPQVGLTLRGAESQRVWLLGRLHHPGVYSLATPMTLLEAVTRAGGPMSPASLASLSGGPLGANFSQDFADLRRSFVIRDGTMVPVDFYALLRNGNLSENIYLRSGDFVYLPSAVTLEVFVLGAVYEPRSVSYRQRMTLVSAIANAQGTIKDAYLSHVAIVRGSLTQPQIAVVNYKAVIKGEQPDVPLEPGDIVYVPFAPYRTLERYVNMILNTFVTTVGINEGSRFVSGNVPPVGVSIGGNPSTGTSNPTGRP